MRRVTPISMAGRSFISATAARQPSARSSGAEAGTEQSARLSVAPLRFVRHEVHGIAWYISRGEERVEES